MPRDRIKTTREDATGFEEKPKGARKRSILKPFDHGALASFAKRKRVTKTADEQSVTPPDQPKSKGDHRDSDAAVGLTETQDLDVQPAADEAGEWLDPQNGAPANGLAELVVPPRAKSADTLHLTLRLRVLNRHVPALNRLATQGIKPDTVLRKAYSRLPPIRFEVHYVPRVAEPSGPVTWNHRVTVTVMKGTLQAIEAQVRDGANAPRSHLLLGQIERTWFASLEDTIKELSK
ncbi:hypothetical protein RAH32_17565 [Paracoccus sp. WLY502]|uniref:hypothetical protein n=1 Tax=Paracoccus yibinensis TaxID=3068891 RepID=UPI00279681D0|nr:hypothetical protein [Paracoccus sp. WLY502]MDQ1902233.1 hypothetical protein [Paracoccus sp. WLY502]